MSKKLFSSLFQYKAWANGELFALLQSVPEASHPQGMRVTKRIFKRVFAPKGMHMAGRILNHVFIVDQIFKANLVAEQHAFKALNTEETPKLGDLWASVRRVDQWYLQYVDSLDESRLGEPMEFTFTDGSAGRMTREEMLAHVVTHGNYHRGQVSAILNLLSVPLPRDIFTQFLHLEGRRPHEDAALRA